MVGGLGTGTEFNQNVLANSLPTEIAKILIKCYNNVMTNYTYITYR